MRKCADWISKWLEYSSGVESPLIYRTWAGLATISAALQRRVFVRVKSQELFPNLYILLVGEPGIGKGNAMKELRSWVKDVNQIHSAPDGLTKRSFFEVLEGAVVENPNNPLIHECSLFAFVEELGVFMHAGDTDFIYVLCHVYDTPPFFWYKTFGAGENLIERICFGFIAGVTPKALKDIFSEQAMELGISARTVLVYSDERVKVPVFTPHGKDEQLRKDLQSDLMEMSGLRGEYIFDEEAAKAVVDWTSNDMPPIPQDPRFKHYNTRRFVQFIKLCMTVAASRRNDLAIIQPDVMAAQTVLLEAERFMPRAIESLGANPLLYQQQTALKYINSVYTQRKKACREAELRRRLSMEVHPTYLDVLIDQLARAKWVDVIGERPDRLFLPRGQKEEDTVDTGPLAE